MLVLNNCVQFHIAYVKKYVVSLFVNVNISCKRYSTYSASKTQLTQHSSIKENGSQLVSWMEWNV
jgi:hypothetical protein